MVRSMTGFGRGEYSRDGKEFTVEVKTVNHRYFDIYIKMPRQIGFLEDRVRELLGKAISRGKIDVYITYTNYGDDAKRVVIDEQLAKAYISALEELRDKFSLADDISVSILAKCPDVMKVEQDEEDGEQLWEILKTALDNAVASLIRMREIEGEALKFWAGDTVGVNHQEVLHQAPEIEEL